MVFIHLLYWGRWRGSAPYLWVEKGGIIEPAEVLPPQLLAALSKLPPGLSHIADWSVLAYPDGSAFLASAVLNQATIAELAAAHFPAPWRRLTDRSAA